MPLARRSASCNNIASRAIRLVRALGYTGLGSLEFKRRTSDGRYYFIEMNTRLPWYNGLFKSAGVNFSQLAYEELTGKTGATEAPRQRDSVHWMALRQCRQRSSVPGSNLLSTVLRSNSFAWWNPADPGPFLGSMRLALERVPARFARAIGNAPATAL